MCHVADMSAWRLNCYGFWLTGAIKTKSGSYSQTGMRQNNDRTSRRPSSHAHKERELHMKNKGILALIFVMATGVLSIVGLMVSTGSSAAGPTTVGIDFNTADNTATSVGAITTCLEVPSGGSYTLDVYVQNVPGDTDPTTPDGMVAGQFTFD